MSNFKIKQWNDRKSENPNRYRLEQIMNTKDYDIVRADNPEVGNEGTPLNAATFNDLEKRIGDAFTSVESSVEQLQQKFYIDLPHDWTFVSNGNWNKQTISNSNIKEANNYMISLDTTDLDAFSTLSQAYINFNYILKAEYVDGSITFYCKVPTNMDLRLLIQSV